MKGYVSIHLDSAGATHVFLCPECGQPGEPGQRCNSGIHQGVGAADGPLFVPSYELAAGAGVAAIAAERRRQIDAEGFTREEDEQLSAGQLVDAALCYLTGGSAEKPPSEWPWDESWWKPRDTTANLTRAAALIAAELDRRRRVAVTRGTRPG